MTDSSDCPGGDLTADWLRLALTSGVGPRTCRALLDRFGTPQGVVAASLDELKGVNGVGPKLAQAIVAARSEVDVEAELALCRANDLGVMCQSDPAYPRMLRSIPDPPLVLFIKGKLIPEDVLAVAMVGSRHATRYGIAQAERLAGGLARAGLTIVSGLARGIDAAAHQGALAAGGRTLAVLGSGLLEVYPPEHRELALKAAAHGALLSELPPRKPPVGAAFPQRNRIITGLSLGVIVVEASERSGALISARHAMEQGREVFAVPGRVDSRMSRGCHRLIRDGAKLVESVEDVLEELGPLPSPEAHEGESAPRHPGELALNDVERQVLSAIDPDPTAIDAVVARSGLPVHSVLSTISVLEMRRIVRRVSGQFVIRL